MERKPDWLPGFPVQIYCNRREVAVEYRPDFRHFGFPEMLWQAEFSICVEKAVFLQQRHRVFR